jgi:hypothetical protein
MRDRSPGLRVGRSAVRGTALAALLPVLLVIGLSGLPSAQKAQNVPSMLREIEKTVREIGGYPGEDFIRREFFLGVGDDDTYKTHHVGIVIKDEDEGPRMTIQITRLEAARDDPRVKLGRESKTIISRFRLDRVEVVRSDYPPEAIESVLADVLRAVVGKRNLLKK